MWAGILLKARHINGTGEKNVFDVFFATAAICPLR
jgi:hypothetical protein